MNSHLRQIRVTLANLKPAPGSQQNQKRVGRGQGSGYGGTAGRGSNGQKSRSGVGLKPGFEGGQTPITKRFPKRGFVSQNAKTYAPVNLDRIQHWIDQGRLSSSQEKPITARDLLLSGCIHDAHDGIKILGNGGESLKSPVFIMPSRASKSAIAAIEKNGGKVVCVYHNTLSLQDCIKGRDDRTCATPTRREDIIWYSRHRNRGYLSTETLGTIDHLAFAQEKWKFLAQQLGTWKKQDFNVANT